VPTVLALFITATIVAFQDVLVNIILIAVDTLRATQLGCYGYPKPTSPTLDQLAKEGLLFEEMLATSIPTTPAYTTIYTGKHAIEHGIVQHGGEAMLDEGFTLLPEILQRAGFATGAVDDLRNLKPWLGRGYDFYIDMPSRLFTKGEQLVPAAQEWLGQHRTDPFFLFLHFWDTHIPYLPPLRYRRMFYDGDPYDPAHDTMAPVRAQRVWPIFKEMHYDLLVEAKTKRPVMDIDYITAQYDAEVRYVDDQIARVVAAMEELGLTGNTALVITSDHGESLTEHGIYFEHNGLYDQTLRVPLIIWAPGSGLQGRIKGLVTHQDLLPTLLSASQQPVPEDMQDRDLLALARKGTASDTEFICTCECTWRAAWAFRSRKWKLIRTLNPGAYTVPARELYDLESDPEEQHDLATQHPDIANKMEKEREAWKSAQLAGRPDPVQEWGNRHLPGVGWLERTIKENRKL
jgi:arylsulfatase